MSARMQRRIDEIERQGLEVKIRTLTEQLAESRGAVRGAVAATGQIAQRNTTIELEMAQLRRAHEHAVRDARLMRRLVAEHVVNVRDERRDPLVLVEILIDDLMTSGVNLNGDVRAAQGARTTQDVMTEETGDGDTSPIIAAVRQAAADHQAEVRLHQGDVRDLAAESARGAVGSAVSVAR